MDMTEFSPYYDPTITHTKNVWEYYFEQTDCKTYPESNDIIEIGVWNAKPESAYCNLSRVTSEKRQKIHNIIKRYIRPLAHIQEKIDAFATENEMAKKKILGVHCRGGNAAFDCAYPISPEQYNKEIEAIERDYDTIFVISDQQNFVDTIHARFGNKVLFFKNTSRTVLSDRAETITNVAHGYKLKDKYKAGEGCIIDAYLLGYSTFLICPYSNVSTFSHYLNTEMQYVDLDLKYGHTKLP
jgi:hypothetical protein